MPPHPTPSSFPIPAPKVQARGQGSPAGEADPLCRPMRVRLGTRTQQSSNPAVARPLPPCESCTHRDGTSHFVRAGGGRRHHPHARSHRHTRRAVPSSSKISLETTRGSRSCANATTRRGLRDEIEMLRIGCASYRASKAGGSTGSAATCFVVLPASFFSQPGISCGCLPVRPTPPLMQTQKQKQTAAAESGQRAGSTLHRPEMPGDQGPAAWHAAPQVHGKQWCRIGGSNVSPTWLVLAGCVRWLSCWRRV